MKFLVIVVFLLSGLLNAGVYPPLLKSKNGTKIIDLGWQNNIDVIKSTPKIWATYLADFNLIDGIIYTRKRILSEREPCITDQLGVTNCPLLGEACDTQIEYAQGSSNEIDTFVDLSASCILGTTYNPLKERCEIVAVPCEVGVFNSDIKMCELEPSKVINGYSWISKNTFFNNMDLYNINQPISLSEGVHLIDGNTSIYYNPQGSIVSNSIFNICREPNTVEQGETEASYCYISTDITNFIILPLYKDVCDAGWELTDGICQKEPTKVGQIVKYLNDATFIVPPEVDSIRVRMCGAGGAGAMDYNTEGRNGGGYAGKYVDALLDVLPFEEISLSVGIGGKREYARSGYNNHGKSGTKTTVRELEVSGGSGGRHGSSSYGGGTSFSTGAKHISLYDGTAYYDGGYHNPNKARGGQASAFGNGGRGDLYDNRWVASSARNGGPCAGGGALGDGRRGGYNGSGGDGVVVLSWETICPPEAPYLDSSVCHTPTICGSEFTKVSETTCRQFYSYYDYTCPIGTNEDGIPFVPTDNGLDCKGLCPTVGRKDQCVCNSELPALNNCSQASYSCPLDETRKCTKKSTTSILIKPLIMHKISGEELSPEAFGIYEESSCGIGCGKGIKEIYGAEDRICFKKTNNNTSCISSEKCTFTGRIDSSDTQIATIWSEGNSIKAMDEFGKIINTSVDSSCQLNGSVGHKGRIGPITSFIIEDETIKFWNPYLQEGYLGELEMIRNVNSIDISDGYELDIKTPWEMRDAGFNNIVTHKNKTYAISKDGMNLDACIGKAEEFGFQLQLPVTSIPAGDRVPYDIVMNTTGGFFNDNAFIISQNAQAFITSNRCVLIKEDFPLDFSVAINAVKDLEEGDGSYFCSTLTCNAQKSCQFASCVEGFNGSLISSVRPEPKPVDCKDTNCDANLAYYQWCGENGGCNVTSPMIQEIDGSCYETVCAEGGFDSVTGLCFKWQCPDGYIEDTSGGCIKQ